MRHLMVVSAAVLMAGPSALQAGFFSVNDLEAHPTPPSKLYGVFEGPEREPTAFHPCLEARVKARDAILAKDVVAKAYFFDAAGRQVAVAGRPSPAQRGSIDRHAMPAIFPKNGEVSLFFRIPDGLNLGGARALVVFGDAREADARVYPRGSFRDFDFPEKPVVEGKQKRIGGERKEAIDPIVEHVVNPETPKQPKITIFLRPPVGVTDGADIRGVLAMCVLADRVDAVKRQLQGLEAGKEVSGLLGFAQRNRLAVISWGSRRLWDPGANYDDQNRATNRGVDDDLEAVSEAWERGVGFLCRKYGLPERNMLLWGASGAGQWAHRLALRKPDRFLAVHVHIPSSFDKPTPEAARLLWLLTTGEAESGYERAIRFYRGCRDLGYPMVFKAIPGLGHEGSPLADKLGLEFFQYALSVQDRKEAWEAAAKDALRSRGLAKLWAEDFSKAAFVGDYLNQDCFPAAESDRIREALRVPLPTKAIADAWRKEPNLLEGLLPTAEAKKATGK